MRPLNRVESQAVFLDWLDKERPEVYDALDPESVFDNLSGLGESLPPATEAQAVTGGIESVINKLADAVPSYFQYRLTSDLYKLNMERARQGLAPIDPGAVAPQFQVGVSQNTLQWLVFGFLGVAILMAIRGRS